MSLKTWGIKLYPVEHDRINQLITDEKETSGVKTKREAFLNVLSRLDETDEPFIQFVDQGELDSLYDDYCELDFLKKIVDPKDGIKKWFCLRLSRPDRGGKPILMSDGRDHESIKALCQACKDGFMWARQKDLSADQIEAIKKFGEEEITAHLFICNHPDIEYVQLTPSPRHEFLCLFSNRRESVEKRCLREPCDHLIHHRLKVVVKETPQYEELQKQLEES